MDVNNCNDSVFKEITTVHQQKYEHCITLLPSCDFRLHQSLHIYIFKLNYLVKFYLNVYFHIFNNLEHSELQMCLIFHSFNFVYIYNI